MIAEGNSLKMTVAIGDPIQYQLRLGDQSIPLNEHIGKSIKLSYLGRIDCIVCGRKTSKSFAQGMCYPCMLNSPQNSECIIRPELCRGHLGEGRDSEWEAEHHVREHFVYLAVSSQIKVGVTRADQIPTRWIDQGASAACILATTPHRCAAGELEVALKEAFTDRTSWQKMLKNDVMETPNWAEAFEQAKACVPDSHREYLISDPQIQSLDYPVHSYPSKVKSQSFDKVDAIEGQLNGIKGQYLLFDGDRVLNIRKHNGYLLRFEA